MTSVETASVRIAVRVARVSAETGEISVFELAPIVGVGLPAAEAGAHIGLIAANGIERQYSLLDSEAEPRTYRVGIKREAEGLGGSRYFHEHLRPGVELSIAPPRNNFPLAEDAANSILIAGGIGITPIWCMAKRLRALGRLWTLHYACRSRADAAFLSEIEPNGQTHLHFDCESGGAFLDVARIATQAPADAHLYCCGPRPMLAAFEQATVARPPSHVHVEYFAPKYDRDLEGATPSCSPVPGGRCRSRRARRFWRRFVPLGMTLASSCEEGVCGACETRVLEGEPDHRDVILSPDERVANETMFICCSGCKGKRLVLDL